MSRIIIISLVIIFESLTLRGQQLEGSVSYRYDLKLENVKISREATLIFSNSASIFYHSRGKGIVAVDIDGNVGGPDLTYTTGSDHDGTPVVDFYRKDKWGHSFYFDHQSNCLSAREMVYFRPFSYREEPLEKIEWKREDSTKVIGQYLCLAATTVFRGRNYLAWYTPEIPVPLGPWKLRGLPGLILEVSDHENRVVYRATSISAELTDEQREQIRPPADAPNVVSFEEFKEVYRKEQFRLVRQFSSTAERSDEQQTVEPNPTLEIFTDY